MAEAAIEVGNRVAKEATEEEKAGRRTRKAVAVDLLGKTDLALRAATAGEMGREANKGPAAANKGPAAVSLVREVAVATLAAVDLAVGVAEDSKADASTLAVKVAKEVRAEIAAVAVEAASILEAVVERSCLQPAKCAAAQSASSRRAMTLLELILALALSVVVLSAVGSAIHLYFKMLDARRTSIEEMQTVRVVVMRITSDIRACVQPYKPDLEGLETTFQNAMQAATAQADAQLAGAAQVLGGQVGGQQGQGGQSQGGQTQGGQGQQGQGQQGQGQQGQGQQSQGTQGQAGQSTGGQGGSGPGQTGSGQTQGAGGQAGSAASGTGASGAGAAGSSAASTEPAASSTPTVVLTGTATELRFDISRLPRMDQYQGIISKGELSAVDLPSDVKTIVYFIRSDTSAQTYLDDPYAPGGEPSVDGYGRGLMRAELDRAVSSYAETGGATDGVYSSAQLLAEEVVGLGFEYFDGTEWLTEWDSSSQGLPRAIKIWLSVQPTYGMTDEELAKAAGGVPPEPTDMYFTVSLPTTPLVVPAASETTDASSSTSASTSSATSSTTTTGAASGAAQGAMP